MATTTSFDMTHAEASTVLNRSIEAVLSAIDSPRSLAVYLLWKHGEHAQLVDLGIKPGLYSSAEQFRGDYLATELLSKADFLALNVDRAEVARLKFLKSEERCRETNRNLEAWSSMGCHPPGVASAIYAMQWKISTWLGEFDPEEFVSSCGWGPGANVGLKRRHATGYYKFGMKPTVTTRCLSFVQPWFSAAFPQWSASIGGLDSCEEVVGTRFSTVPKNAKTDRVINIEPMLNLYLQKGIGRMLKKRLAWAGFPIRDQETNKELSRIAYSLEYSTIDFSAASDSISGVLVDRVIPPSWKLVMDQVRSEYGTVRGVSEPLKWEKYSTMGNGFTFELETLVFLSLACHVCDIHGLGYEGVTVFGDDVIIPTICVDDFVAISGSLGFTVNVEKTWTNGPFRESCGAHWFRGQDVKPFYIRSTPAYWHELYRVLNRLREYAAEGMGYGCDSKYRHAWVSIHSLLPKNLKHVYGPLHLGDSVIWENLDSAVKYVKSVTDGQNWIGFAPKRVVFAQKVEDKRGHSLLVSRCHQLDSGLPEDGESASWQSSNGIETENEVSLGNDVPVIGIGDFRIRSGLKRPDPRWTSPGPWF